MTSPTPPVGPGPEEATGPAAQRTRLARLRFLATPRWIVLQAAVIIFVLSCYFLLAPWQFARNQQHVQQMDAVAAATAQDPVPLADLLSTTAQPSEDLRWRQVTATGHFDADHEAYIRLRQDAAGQPAYEVVVPFITDSGTVLVDRGYFPFQAIAERSAEPPAPPSGTVTIIGRVQPDQTDPKNRPPSTTPDGRTAYLAVSSQILGTSGTPVYRGFVELTTDSPGVIDPIPLPQGDDSRPFFSYAIQWLSFGAIAVIGLGFFIYREYTDPVDGRIYVDEAADSTTRPAPSGAPPRTDGPTDEPTDESAPGPPHHPAKKARFDKSLLYDD